MQIVLLKCKLSEILSREPILDFYIIQRCCEIFISLSFKIEIANSNIPNAKLIRALIYNRAKHATDYEIQISIYWILSHLFSLSFSAFIFRDTECRERLMIMS